MQRTLGRRGPAVPMPPELCTVNGAGLTVCPERTANWYRAEHTAQIEAVDLFIYDQIVDPGMAELFGLGVSALGFVQELQTLKGKPINLHINSPGGLVFGGLAIYNALRQHDGPVHVIVDGIAASIASVIAMAGDTVVMAPHAMLMIHEPFGMTMGPASDHAKMAEVLGKEADAIAGVYAERADKRRNWRALMSEETWFSDQEAVAAGLADRIDTSIGPATKNAFDLSHFHRVPAALVGSLNLAGGLGTEDKAVGVHHTDTTDASWDGPANRTRVKSGEDTGYYRKIFAWQDPDKEPGVKSAWRYIHHQVSADGTPGAANETACSTGIGVLNGGRGGTTIPAADREGVYRHLAAHLRDAGKEPPQLDQFTDHGDEHDDGDWDECDSTVPTIRDAERALRDAGFSRSAAKAIVAEGWRAERDASAQNGHASPGLPAGASTNGTDGAAGTAAEDGPEALIALEMARFQELKTLYRMEPTIAR